MRSVHSHHHDISPVGHRRHKYMHSNYLHSEKSKGLEIVRITAVHYIKSYLSQLLFEPSMVKRFVVSKTISVPH